MASEGNAMSMRAWAWLSEWALGRRCWRPAVHKTTGANMTFTLQPVPANLAREGSRKGGNPMGVPTEAHQCNIVEVSHFALQVLTRLKGGPHWSTGHTPKTMKSSEQSQSRQKRNGRS